MALIFVLLFRPNSAEQRITATELDRLLKASTSKENHQSSSASSPLLLLDVRSQMEVEMCSLPGTVNLPIQHFADDNGLETNGVGHSNSDLKAVLASHNADSGQVIVICRRGNDSQLAVAHLRRRFPHLAARDVIGGLHAWARDVDPSFPVY
jgi:adenylyltransferase/sulfurtransferase